LFVSLALLFLSGHALAEDPKALRLTLPASASIGNIPPAEAEARYYASLEELSIAA
jgi:hypothetical protein